MQLQELMDETDKLVSFQYVFRAGFGIKIALVIMMDSLCKQNVTLLIFPFSINNSIFLDRLSKLGTGALYFCGSYLDSIFQKIALGDYGILQGFSLSLILSTHLYP